MSRKHPQKRAKGDERLAADLKSNRAECPGKPQFTRADLREVGPCCYELSREGRPSMLAPARIYADEALLEAMLQGETLNQLANVASLPGITGCVYGMPDMHTGYGFPVGGVAAMELPHGMVSPGGVGFDINCGVRLISLPITREAAGAGAARPPPSPRPPRWTRARLRARWWSTCAWPPTASAHPRGAGKCARSWRATSPRVACNCRSTWWIRPSCVTPACTRSATAT